MRSALLFMKSLGIPQVRLVEPHYEAKQYNAILDIMTFCHGSQSGKL